MRSRTFAAALAAVLALPALGRGAEPEQSGAPATAWPAARPPPTLPLAQPLALGDDRNPMMTVATTALYGGGAGAVVGVGVALIEGGHWVRDVTVAAGLGVLTGAAVGAYMAYGGSDRVALDGLGTPERDRDRQRPMPAHAAYAFRW